jgi:hypothetical protein
MRLRLLCFFWLLSWAVFAQIPEDELRSRAAGARYLPLAEVARIQGDVRIHVNSGMVTVLSGHPLLAQTAVENAKSISSLPGAENVDVTYHFLFTNTTIILVPTPVTVKRGNVLERPVLRMFGRKTEKVIIDYPCVSVPPPNDVWISGSLVEIWIYGREFCAQPEQATLLAQR